MPGNWKLDSIIQSLGDAGRALPSHSIATDIDMTPRQLSNYIRHNLLNKYVTATQVPIHSNHAAPWRNFYTLTELGWTKYRRLSA